MQSRRLLFAERGLHRRNFSINRLLFWAQSVHPDGKQALRKTPLDLGKEDVQASQFENLPELLIRPGHAAVLVVEDVLAIEVSAQVFLDDNGASLGEVFLATLEVLDQLGVCEVADAPLVPDQVVLVRGIQGPVLQADVGDGADAAGGDEFLAALGLLQLVGELLHGLNDVDGLGNLQEEAKGDAADAGATVDGVREKLAGLEPGDATQLVVEDGRALQVYARDLGEAAEHAIDGGLDRVPVVDGCGMVDGLVRSGWRVLGHFALGRVGRRRSGRWILRDDRTGRV